MRVKSIPSKWLVESGVRLDCSPYMAGELEARAIIDQIKQKKATLAELTLNGISGIQNIGRIKRLWVQDNKDGIPFLTGRDIQKADLTDCSKIAKSVVKDNPKLIIHDKWTLITRSGSIGQTAYARPEMDGMACTEDVLRVIPDESKIPPGYLYAFLSSKFGIPQIISGTYGAIIQHIEPEHIADLPVPRLGDKKEREIHELVQEAAELRSQAAAGRSKVRQDIETFLQWNNPTSGSLHTRIMPSSIVSARRLDSRYHSMKSENARIALGRFADGRCLSNLADSIFEPNRSARNKVTDPSLGVPFISFSQIFRVDQTADFSIANNTPFLSTFTITKTDVLIPRSGSLGGVIGRACLPFPKNFGAAGSDHLIRVRCPDMNTAFEIFALLSTRPGYFSALSTAFGSAIPSLDCELLGQLQISKLPKVLREKVIKIISLSVEQYQRAFDLELGAQKLVKKAIEG